MTEAMKLIEKERDTLLALADHLEAMGRSLLPVDTSALCARCGTNRYDDINLHRAIPMIGGAATNLRRAAGYLNGSLVAAEEKKPESVA